MLHRLLLFVCAVVLLTSASIADAQQSCTNTYGYYYDPTFTCDTSGTGSNICNTAQPVSFSLQQWISGADTKSCATVVWSFGDGSPDVTVNGAATVQHTFPAGGRYTVKAGINTSHYPVVYQDQFQITVGRGAVGVQGSFSSVEGNPFSLSIVRSNVSMATTVQWTLEGSSAALSRYSVTSGTVTLDAGQVSKSFTIPTVDDAVFNGNNEGADLKLTSATNDYLVPSGNYGLFLEDNDWANISWASTQVSFPEDGGIAHLNVTRSGITDIQATVQYEIYGGNIVVGGYGTLVFAPGETTRSIPVPVVDNDQWTGNRNAEVRLGWSTSAGTRIVGSTYLALTITEDDPLPTITVEDIAVPEGDSGSANVVLKLRMSQAVPNYYVNFSLVPRTASMQQDFEYAAPFFTYVPFNGTEATVNVKIIGDTKHEPHETFDVVFHWGSHQQLKPEPVSVTILNDEVELSPESARIANGESASFVLDIGLPSDGSVAVPLSFDANVVSGPQSIAFAAGESTKSIELVGHTAGSSDIIATLPASRGGRILRAGIAVHDHGSAVFEPKRLALRTGEEASVNVSLQPAGTQNYTLPLRSNDAGIADVTAGSVFIAASTVGTFKVKGIAAGTTSIRLTLPEQFGNEVATLVVDVTDAPPAPTITAITPVTGPSGGGTAFEVTGTALAANCTILFGGTPASNVALNGATKIKGNTPPHSAGAVDVVLQCGAQTSTLPNAFSYIGVAPTISAVSPSFGSTGGGTHVRASVTNVQSGCWMFFGNSAATNVWINGGTEMTATTPRRTESGAVDVSVRCGVESASKAAAFAYSDAMEPSLSILTIEPLSGAPGESVTIRGSRFRPTDRISFDEQASSIVRTQPDTHVVRIPELPAGMASIDIVDAEGRLTTTGPIFTIKQTPPPYLGAVTPSTTVAGAEIVLTGRALRPGFTFSIGGTVARVVSIDLERAVLRLANGIAPGAYPIDVLDSKGNIAATGPTLTIAANGLTLRSVSPGCDDTNGGDRVTLHGTGFASGAAVTFNGTAAGNVQWVNATTMHATVPPGTTGAALIAVMNPDGKTATASDQFTYRSPFDPAGCGSRGRSVRH
jgi:IPT/TIG domain/PKD domain/Calx-beta domain